MKKISNDNNHSDSSSNKDDSDYKDDHYSDDEDEIVFNTILDNRDSKVTYNEGEGNS